MDLKNLTAVGLVATPILTLFLAGIVIAAKSGVDHVSSGKDLAQIAGNFSAMMLRVAGYVVVLMLVQHLIGLRPTFGW